MVLKKSNSHLNSGVTQRLTNKGAFLRNHHIRDHANPGTVSVFLSGHEDGSKESWAIFQDGLNTIYDYLALQGPDLSLFYDRDGLTRPQLVFNEFSYIRNQTDACIPLSEKIKKMIDAKVLDPVTQNLEVEITIFKRCPQKKVNSKNVVFSWKSTEKKSKTLNTKEERKMRRKRDNPNTHHRGVQRRNRSFAEEQDTDEEDSFNVSSRRISLNFEEPYAVDGRLVNRSYSTRKIFIKERGKSCSKLKSFVNGLRSDLKGYNFSSLKEDEMEALLDVDEEEDSFLHDEDFRHTADEVDDDEDFAKYSWSESGICLADCFTTGSKVHRSNKHSYMFNTNHSKLMPLNSASSEKVVRHPKGSCVFIKATSEEMDDSDVDTDSGFEGNSSFKSESTDDQDQERQTVENIIDSKNFEFELMANIDAFISKFIEVHLILPPDIIDSLLSSSTADTRYSDDDCCISFGNCYPSTFVMKLNSDEGISASYSLYLTGKASEMNDNPSWKWQVQVGRMNTCEPDGEIVDRITSTLQRKIVGELTLKDLIHIFTESLEFDLQTANQSAPTSTLNSYFSLSKNRQSPWCELAHFTPMSAQTICLAEALDKMDNTNDDQVYESKCSFQFVDMSQASSSIVCDICFLPCDFSQSGDSEALALRPCGHIFCLTCWSSYVHVSLCNADSIQCMDSDCKHELNETLLRSLAPGPMVNKWLQRLEDKAIERNPLSKWCPNTHCDMVALLPHLSAKVSQFGSLVLCGCQRQWCFSCQTEPHWPASCEQMAAFRKLLAKTGNDLEIPAAQVDFTIQLKRCPRCHYPIEKNQGCPSMVCRMCWFNFCWNCLRAVDHSVYSCKARDDNYDTFNLQNKLVHELPLKFFPDFLEMNRKRKNLENRQICSWFQMLQLYNSKRLKIPLKISLEIASNDEAKSKVINVAYRTVEFLIQVYTLLESCYVLLSFVNMITGKRRKSIILVLHEFVRLAETLHFITCRLEHQIVCKPVLHILNHAKNAEMLIRCGKKQMSTMARDLHILQNLTKDIDASRVGDIDPMTFLRYK